MAENANFLAKDDYASNLYFHMADEVIKRLIFQNPYKEKAYTYSLDLATRSSMDIDDMPLSEQQEYKRQGYKELTSVDGNRRYYSIADTSMYRIILANHLIESGKVGIKINNLRVRSIFYRHQVRDMEFLYLADSICSCLGYNLPGETPDEWLCEIRERIQLLNGGLPNNPYIFGYDDMDIVLDQSMAFYKLPDFCKMYDIIYDAMQEKGEFPQLYAQTWFKQLVDRSIKSKNITAFTQSIRSLNKALHSNKLDQAKLLFIFENLEKKAETILSSSPTDEEKSVIYLLYDAGISIYSYIGNIAMAIACYEKCKQYLCYADPQKIVVTQRKVCVLLNDSFQFDQALHIAKDIVTYQELISDAQRILIDNDSDIRNTEDAKSLSLLGQLQSFLRLEQAEVTLQKALRLLPKDSGNFKITLSYLLHHYLDTGKKEAYLKESNFYFGEQQLLSRQLNYILSEGIKETPTLAPEYALYVWIKGVYLFRSDELNDATWMKLADIRNHIASKSSKNMGYAINDHPWELIYTYIQLLAIKRGEPADVLARIKSQCEAAFSVKSTLIEALILYGNIRVAHAQNDIPNRDETIQKLVQYLKTHVDIFEHRQFPSDCESCYEQLQGIFTYMYN